MRFGPLIKDFIIKSAIWRNLLLVYLLYNEPTFKDGGVIRIPLTANVPFCVRERPSMRRGHGRRRAVPPLLVRGRALRLHGGAVLQDGPRRSEGFRV